MAWAKGEHHSEDTKKKLSEAGMRRFKGKKGAFFGKHHSPETKLKISKSMKKNCISWNRGLKGVQSHSPAVREQISKSLSGRKLSEKHKMKIIGTGRRHSDATKRKVSGENCHLWRGGISFETYTVNWTNTLKRSIRERDYYACRLCGKQQEEVAFSIHHIDYDKKNCNPDNLITLCKSCHGKTNQNRECYSNVLKEVLIMKKAKK